MNDLAKGIILPGAALIVAGLVLMLFPKVPSPGRFPGDFLIKRENAIFSFPLTTSILIIRIRYLVGRFRWVLTPISSKRARRSLTENSLRKNRIISRKVAKLAKKG